MGTDDPEEIGRFLLEDFLLQDRKQHLDDCKPRKLKVVSVKINEFTVRAYPDHGYLSAVSAIKVPRFWALAFSPPPSRIRLTRWFRTPVWPR